MMFPTMMILMRVTFQSLKIPFLSFFMNFFVTSAVRDLSEQVDELHSQLTDLEEEYGRIYDQLNDLLETNRDLTQSLKEELEEDKVEMDDNSSSSTKASDDIDDTKSKEDTAV